MGSVIKKILKYSSLRLKSQGVLHTHLSTTNLNTTVSEAVWCKWTTYNEQLRTQLCLKFVIERCIGRLSQKIRRVAWRAQVFWQNNSFGLFLCLYLNFFALFFIFIQKNLDFDNDIVLFWFLLSRGTNNSKKFNPKSTKCKKKKIKTKKTIQFCQKT